MLLGLAALASRWHAAPRSGQTLLSQIMAMAVGRNWAHNVMSLTIMVVLALAANTSFGGLPVLASLLATNNHSPTCTRCATTGSCSPPGSGPLRSCPGPCWWRCGRADWPQEYGS